MKKRAIVLVIICIALMSVGLFTACDKLTVGQPMNVKYDGSVISWDKLDKVSGYNVKIIDSDGTIISERTATSNSYVYNSKGKSFRVEIYGVASSGKANKKPKITAVDFQALATIDKADIVIGADGALTWKAIEGANGYMVRVNGYEAVTVDSCAYDGLVAGSSKVEIKPIVKGNASFFSVYSGIKTLTILKTPYDVKYDGGQITWSGEGSLFEVYVNDQLLESDKIIGRSIIYDSGNKNFKVSVKSIGDHSVTYDSKSSAVASFVYLSTATNIRMEGGALVWDAVEGANGYKIKINGAVQPQVLSKNEYVNLDADTNYAIEIMAISDAGKTFSTWSAVKNVRLLPSPILNWQLAGPLDGEVSNCISWNAVNGADGYCVTMTKPNGETVKIDSLGKDIRHFGESFLDVGRYKITIMAKAPAANINLSDSMSSKPIEVVRLASPKQSANFVTSNVNSNAGFTVSFTKVAGATKYQLYKDGQLVVGKTTDAQQILVDKVGEESSMTEQSINYSIKAMGDIKQSSEGITTAYLDSLTNDASKLAFEIKILAKPTNVDIKGFAMQWDAIAGANGYAVSYDGAIHDAGANNFDMSQLPAGEHNPVVSSKGNGSMVLPSFPTASINIIRCEAPSNIRIGYEGEANGKLTCSVVNGAKPDGYMAYFGSDAGTAMKASSIDNLASKINTTQGTQVHMYADANEWRGNTYYMTSLSSETKTFVKLDTPTFGDTAFTNTEFLWNHNHNKDYSPKYIVYDGAGVAYKGGTTTAERFDISKIAAGSSSFQVKAIGNGEKYINSEMSATQAIEKLATPLLKVTSDKYTWEGVNSASSYQLLVNGQVACDANHVSGTSYSYTPSVFNSLGSYAVKLVAVGDERHNKTINSEPAELTQAVKQLTSPEFSVSYSAPAYTVDGTINIEVTKKSNFAKGYCYSIGGVKSGVIEMTTYSAKPTTNTTGTFGVKVYAVGGVFDTLTNDYYIDSRQDIVAKEITLLGEPSLSTLYLTRDGVIKWDIITKAPTYNVEYRINEGAWVTAEMVIGNSLTIPNFVYDNVTTLDVRIRANGNGTNIINSATTEKRLK